MSTPVLFLSALVVLSSAFPAQVVQVGSVPARVRQFLVPAVFSACPVSWCRSSAGCSWW
jgi:hypothetical protein